MTLQIEETLADLSIGDYFLGTDGETIWKVVKKREDGYIGIVNKTGDKVIVKPEHTDTRVQQVIFGVDTLEEAQAAAEKRLANTLGAKVVARKIEPGDWQMPSLFEMYDDAIQLKAHLMLHHKVDLSEPSLEHGDFAVIHHGDHLRTGEFAPDHTHEEK
jgi:hypothetical protein